MPRLSFRNASVWLSILLLAVSVVSCKRDPVAKTKTPEGSVQAGAEALGKGDLRAFVLSQVPPKDLDKLRADWKAQAAKPVDPTEAKRFSEQMATFTDADAVDKMMQEFEPKLAEFDREGAAQMPMLIGMITGMAQASIQQNKDLDAAGKAQAMQMVNALTRWVSGAKFTDRAKVRASIEALTGAARGSKVRTLAQMQALPFDAALDEYSRAFRAFKAVLANYGLPLDPVFGSVKTKVLSKTDSTAKVRVSYRMLETDFTHDLDMVKVDDRWYGSKTATQVGGMLRDKDDDAALPLPIAP